MLVASAKYRHEIIFDSDSVGADLHDVLISVLTTWLDCKWGWNLVYCIMYICFYLVLSLQIFSYLLDNWIEIIFNYIDWGFVNISP